MSREELSEFSDFPIVVSGPRPRERKFPDFDDFSVPIGEQVENLRRWNRDFGLGFSPNDFSFIDDQDSWSESSDPERPLQVALTFFCLGDPFATWQAWFRILGLDFEHQAMPKEEDDIRIIPGISYQRGLCLAMIDLGAYRNRGYELSETSPARVINSRSFFCAHFGVLAAAAQLPKWVEQVGSLLPPVFAAGIQVKPENYTWSGGLVFVPYLYSSGSRERAWELELRVGFAPQEAEWCDRYAIPEFTHISFPK